MTDHAGKRPLDVVMIWHSAKSDNLGVGALTLSEIAIVKRLAERNGVPVRITLLDWKDPRPPYVEDPDVDVWPIGGKEIFDPRRVFPRLRRADLVIDITAGDSFTDIYGPKRLRRVFLLKFLTHLARRPLVVAPQTIGPFTHRLSRALARATLNRSALVATRDAMSTTATRELGYRGEIIEASDVALRLPYDRPEAPERARAVVRVGLNVSGLLMQGGYTGKNQFGLSVDYPALIRRLIDGFRTAPEPCEVHLVPHVISYRRDGAQEDDMAASQALAREFPEVVVPPGFGSPSEAKSYIAGLDFFAGARMHACIAAFSSGVPVIPMAYSRKFAGLFGSLGYDRTVDCTTGDTESIADAILAAFSDRARLAEEQSAALARGLEKLVAYETALDAVMRSAWSMR